MDGRRVTRRVTPLRRALFEAERTQVEVAKEVGLDAPTFSRVVCGHVEPNPQTKAAIAVALGSTVAVLWPVTAQDVAA